MKNKVCPHCGKEQQLYQTSIDGEKCLRTICEICGKDMTVKPIMSFEERAELEKKATEYLGELYRKRHGTRESKRESINRWVFRQTRELPKKLSLCFSFAKIHDKPVLQIKTDFKCGNESIYVYIEDNWEPRLRNTDSYYLYQVVETILVAETVARRIKSKLKYK